MKAIGVNHHRTVEVEVKFVPLMVMVKAALPTTIKAGLKLAITGGGGLMAKFLPDEMPVTLLTVTAAVPALAVRAAGIVAVICVALR